MLLMTPVLSVLRNTAGDTKPNGEEITSTASPLVRGRSVVDDIGGNVVGRTNARLLGSPQ